MKILSLMTLVLIGCGQSSSSPISFTISDTGLIDSGAIAIAPNGNYIVSGNIDDTHGEVISSTDGKSWTVSQTFSNGLSIGLGKMVAIGSAMYLTVATGPYANDGYYHTDVYKSLDSGVTWKNVFTTTTYTIMWNNTTVGTKTAVALWGVPQSGYTNGYVDFGWYDTATDTLSITSRLATTGVEQDNFPSETYIYQRPEDSALVAIVRWGESPQVPYSMLYLSQDNGLTWQDMNVTWQGLAGNIFGCKTVDGQFWLAGYQENSRSDVVSAVWNANPDTGTIGSFLYPLGLTGYGTKGNGGIACKGNQVVSLIGNGTLKVVTFSE